MPPQKILKYYTLRDAFSCILKHLMVNTRLVESMAICHFTAITGGGRPTRLLPHAKMLLIPIELFLSAG